MFFKSNSAKIALAAICSRAVCLLVGLVSAECMHPYDTSGNIYPAGHKNVGEWLSPLAYWDGVYFLRTADIEGYEYEHTHAFFPGLPILINVMEGLASSILPEWVLPAQRVDRLLLCGAVITNISFVLASVLLYWLGLAVLSDRKDGVSVAYYGALFFAIPMSNIFMSAIYTESLYSMLTFAGLLLLYTAANAYRPDQSRWAELGQATLALGSAITLAAATLTRSNGTLNAPFLISFGIHTRSLLLAIPLVLLVLLPLPLYLRYAWSLYCSNIGLDNRPWCDEGGNVYSYIQKEYWNVGLFEYYTPNNIPNFLLAVPSMSIAVTAVVRGLSRYCPQLSRAFSPKAWIEGVVSAAYDYKRSPFVFQLMVLTFFTLLCANVQVMTRLLTGCPLYYWQLGSFYDSIIADKKGGGRISTVAFYVYLLFHSVYFFIGPIMFCNFLPWT
ncbi:hypothetical protein FOL47_010574 [Perkinsus chesapeaki]|uniref:GPI mannosyltransferase 2 n=1 Tax=Perkinsus chesapeaki TaxID=330153 RepID=A0A7J6MPB8_PERCH|nr:hypothetical protein FOL47_010574 [Perkinsus chesapeaki]